MKPWVGISLMPDTNFITTTLPLFKQGDVEVIEWSFDTINKKQYEPIWLTTLLNEYANKGRLLGHGVRYSLLSGKWTKSHEKWLTYLSKEIKRYNYRHITEHFGFMTSTNFHKGTSLPVPLNQKSLAVAQDRLMRMQETTQTNVGIENLAFAFSNEQVKEQGDFLEKLIKPVNGFLILDLHNIWCQAMNFRIDPMCIIDYYPLSKVKEIHVSGGSWFTSSTKKKIRRDTHDEAVPEEIFDLLQKTLPHCKNTEAVIFEHMGNALKNIHQQQQFTSNFRRIKNIVNSSFINDTKYPKEKIKNLNAHYSLNPTPLVDLKLHKQQELLVKTFTTFGSVNQTKDLLLKSKLLQKTNWNISERNDDMIETAIDLVKKWG